MISAVPQPSAVSSTICARQTCFCGLLRSATIASSRWRSVALTSTVIPGAHPQTRMSASISGNPKSDSTVRFYPLKRTGRDARVTVQRRHPLTGRTSAIPRVQPSRSESLNGLSNAPTTTWHFADLLARVGEYCFEITHEPIAGHCALNQHAAPIKRVGLAAYQVEFRKAIQCARSSLASIPQAWQLIPEPSALHPPDSMSRIRPVVGPTDRDRRVGLAPQLSQGGRLPSVRPTRWPSVYSPYFPFRCCYYYRRTTIRVSEMRL